MIEMRAELEGKWRKIPYWMRREIGMGSRRGWVNSGDGVIGWNWVSGYVGSRELIPDDIVYFMEYIEGLIGFGDFVGEIGDGFKIRYCLEGGEELIGVGEDRLGAFYDLLYCVGEWYWDNYCPSIKDIGNGYQVESVRNDFEIGESEEGIWIYFEDFWFAREFMNRWGRFVLESRDDYGGEKINHGRMKLMEGEFWIYSGKAEGGVIGMGMLGYSGGVLTVDNLGGLYKN